MCTLLLSKSFHPGRNAGQAEVEAPAQDIETQPDEPRDAGDWCSCTHLKAGFAPGGETRQVGVRQELFWMRRCDDGHPQLQGHGLEELREKEGED